MKSALRFIGDNDRILANVGGEHSELTFLLWARIDGLPRANTALLLVEQPNRWSVHGTLSADDLAAANARRAATPIKDVRWVINHFGAPSLNVGFTGNLTRPLDWDEYPVGSPVVDENQWGRWGCFAVTYDTRRQQVTHYCDGQPVSVSRIRRPVALPVDFVEFGNLSTYESEQDLGVNFRYYGAMDEILISKRAFSAAEILEIYQSGKP
jgi:hypothetical protein